MALSPQEPRADLVGVLHELAQEVGTDSDVQVGTMFRSPGLRWKGKIVAFLGFDGELIVKLPRDRGQDLLATGAAGPVTMGERTMKEWFELPAAASPDEAYRSWLPLVREVLAFVQQE